MLHRNVAELSVKSAAWRLTGQAPGSVSTPDIPGHIQHSDPTRAAVTAADVWPRSHHYRGWGAEEGHMVMILAPGWDLV